MKKLFVLLFTLLSLNAYAFDISSIKNVTCKKENTGADNSNSEMYICSYNKNIEFDNAYGDIISLVSKEIISKNKFVSDKSKAKFESTVKDLILKKYEQYIINEKSKDGVILLVSRYDFGNIANIITNMAVMDEHYDFTITKDENNKLMLMVSKFKGKEYIEVNKNFIEQ